MAVADAATTIPRASVADPWDRLIMATAIALQVPLVTRDSAVRGFGAGSDHLVRHRYLAAPAMKAATT